MLPRRILAPVLLSLVFASSQFAQNSSDSGKPLPQLEFVKINPGDFQMGCTAEAAKCEGKPPAHPVRIDRSFEAGKFQITSEQWKLVMGKYPSSLTVDPQSLAFVSWDEAQLFIQRLNARNDGYRYRLASDAEWEYMARAGVSSTSGKPLYGEYGYGQISGRNDFLILVPVAAAPYDDLNCSIDSNSPTPSFQYKCVHEDKIRPHSGYVLGQKSAPKIERTFIKNGWGLYDMLGSTPEWIEDWPRSEIQDRLVRGNVHEYPLGVTGPGEVFSKRYAPRNLRAYIGFRCVREPIQ